MEEMSPPALDDGDLSQTNKKRLRLTSGQGLLVLCMIFVFAAGMVVGQITTPRPGIPVLAPRNAIGLHRVIDGNTAEVAYVPPAVPVVERLRLIGVDTPERDEPGYKEATEALKAMLKDKPLRIEFEVLGQLERDNFGRLVVYLYADDLLVNAELIRQGWSKHYQKHGRGRLAQLFDEAEKEAKKAKRGLWMKDKLPNQLSQPKILAAARQGIKNR